MDLDKILADHKLWLEDHSQGARADLSNADLRGADLSNADLSNADLRGADLRGADLRGADLSNADLSNADLSGANLRRAIGNRKEVKTLLTSELYHITYTTTQLAIGCQQHHIEDWWAFDDATIAEMDGDALKFWARYKPLLQGLIK